MQLTAKFKRAMMLVQILAIGAVVALSWVDTRQYQVAMREVAETMTPSRLEASKKSIEADVDRYSACRADGNRDANDLEYTAAGRGCLVAAMLKNSTVMGALIFGSTASRWLEKHPDDTEFRSAAITAINSGRRNLEEDRQWLYDSLEKVAKAHDSSVLLRWRDGRQAASSQFDDLAEKIDQAELHVRLPDVAARQFQWKQTQWRLKAMNERASGPAS